MLRIIISGECVKIARPLDKAYGNSRPAMEEVQDKVCMMDIKHIIKAVFSKKNILRDSMERIENRMEGQISSIVDGLKWKQLVSEYPAGTILIPIDLFFDDMEPDNALGSNAGTHKIAAYYLRFPTFPPHHLSSVKYVFEALFHYSKLKAKTFSGCLAALVLVLKELEDGIDIEVDGSTRKVHFILMRILGDNLGLNEILGFMRGMNARKFCRFCITTREESKGATELRDNIMRTEEQYSIDLTNKDKTATGVTEECSFNDLKHFHCINNFTCDVMHDVFEGLVKFDVPKCLNKLIRMKFLTLDMLNSLKQHFDYNEIEIGNMSKPIQPDHLTNNSLRMSASEARAFLHFLPLIIGHLIPEDNEYWHMILILIDISDMVMRGTFDERLLNDLSGLIASYLKLYIKNFGCTLRPKHHFLLHYPECIRQNGPLR
jgi:hypothetical protein